MVDPVQTLGQSFLMSIEKCFLCTGVDGYIPKYDPENQEYGCVARSPNLLHKFKIIVSYVPFLCFVGPNDSSYLTSNQMY